MVIDEYRSSASCALEIEMTNLKNTSIYPWLKLKKETTDLDGIGGDKPEMRINLLTRVQETLKVRNDLRGLSIRSELRGTLFQKVNVRYMHQMENSQP